MAFKLPFLPHIEKFHVFGQLTHPPTHSSQSALVVQYSAPSWMVSEFPSPFPLRERNYERDNVVTPSEVEVGVLEVAETLLQLLLM